MANLEETAKWEEGVYQWETDDPVVGGPDGIDNVPTRQLANRTGYLKTQIETHAAATDPHPQYLQQSEGDTLYDKTGAATASMAGHLAETDPHPQYLQQAEGDTLYDKTGAASASMAGHVAATDPHPQYLQQAEGDQLYDKTGAAASALQAHINAADPHPQYLTETEAAALIQQGTTAPQFDNSTKNATTAFVQRALGNFSAYTMITTAATTLTAAQTGGCFLVNAASAVVTLPNAAQSNLTYTLYAGSAFTLTTPSGSIIGPNSSSASVSIAAHGSIEVISDGGNWEIIGGSAVAPRTVATPAQFDSTNLIATTNFVQRALGSSSGIAGLTAATALTAEYAGKVIYCYANAAHTLPSASGLAAGTTFHFVATLDCTIASSGENILYGGGNYMTSFPLYSGEDAVITTNGAMWYLVSGAAAQRLSPRMASLKSTAGYQKLPSGLIIQWGLAAASTTGSPATNTVSVTFPITFPNAALSCFASFVAANGACSAGVPAYSASGLSVSYANLSGSTLSLQAYWHAIGY